jgi:phage protein D
MKRVALIAASLLAVVGCEDKKEAPAAPKTSSAAPAIPGASTVESMTTEAKDKVVAGYQKTVDEAKTQIDSLAAKLKTAEESQKPAMQEALDKAKSQWSVAEKKLGDLKNSASADWHKVSGEVQSSVDILKKHLSDTMAKFK